MEGHWNHSAEEELFNEQSLLVLMDGNRDDAKAILAAGVDELREIIKRLDVSAKANDFAGILLHASNAQGIAGAMCSQMLGDISCRIVRMAFLRNIDETKLAILDLRGGLKLVGLRLRREGWL